MTKKIISATTAFAVRLALGATGFIGAIMIERFIVLMM